MLSIRVISAMWVDFPFENQIVCCIVDGFDWYKWRVDYTLVFLALLKTRVILRQVCN